MITKVGKVYKFSDLESLRDLDPVCMDDVQELEKVMKPIVDNAEENGLSAEDVKKIKTFLTKLKQRIISTQQGEQREYEHDDLQFPAEPSEHSNQAPSGRAEQENSMSGVSATPGA